MENVCRKKNAALICTHKRGAALALFPNDDGGLKESLFAAQGHLSQLSASLPHTTQLQLTGAMAEFLHHREGGFFYATCAGLTAENLAELYRFALASLECHDAAVDVLGVVEGPGSFTGLRLGCAFVNGLKIGRNRDLYAIGGLHPAEVRQRCSSLAAECRPAFFSAESAEADDPFAVPAAFADLLAHLENWQRGSARSVAVAEPAYGRDPTPVIKLKQHMGAP
ncbi:MAG: hypothetical protein RLZZ488_1159 [Pseudomonadota bacterium]